MSPIYCFRSCVRVVEECFPSLFVLWFALRYVTFPAAYSSFFAACRRASLAARRADAYNSSPCPACETPMTRSPQARSIPGVHTAQGSSSNLEQASTADGGIATTASPALAARTSVDPWNIEPGSTLKARFAAVAHGQDGGRRTTRGHDRTLVGNRANLEAGVGDGRGGRDYGRAAPTPDGEGAAPLPIRRYVRVASMKLLQLVLLLAVVCSFQKNVLLVWLIAQSKFQNVAHT